MGSEQTVEFLTQRQTAWDYIILSYSFVNTSQTDMIQLSFICYAYFFLTESVLPYYLCLVSNKSNNEAIIGNNIHYNKQHVSSLYKNLAIILFHWY